MDRPKRIVPPNNDDTLGVGIESGVILMIFVGIGYLIDRQFGTTPIFIFVLLFVGAIGLFAKLKAEYTSKMDELSDHRQRQAHRSGSQR